MSTFGTRDLALFLPDKAGDVHSLRHTELNEEEVFEPLKPKIDNSKKVVRYFPGKAPVWLGDDGNTNRVASSSSSHNNLSSFQEKKSEINLSSSAIDRRLQRIMKSDIVDVANKGPARRRIYEAEVIVDNDNLNDVVSNTLKTHSTFEDLIDVPDEDEEEDEEDIVSRRNRIKSKMLSLNKVQDNAYAPSSSSHPTTSVSRISGPISNQSESEYETDTDEDSSEEETVLRKPVFVPRNNRETLKEHERKLEIQVELEKQKNVQEQGRKQQTREMVADLIRRNEEASTAASLNLDNDDGRPDDTDDPDDDTEEFENWKLREIYRLKRDSELRELSVLEKADLERRRNLSEAERLEEDKKLGKFDEKEKSKWKFMQKYYHKGVFYMDDDTLKSNNEDVRKRTFDEPTLEDKFNFEALPQVLQVKKFGMRGRTKYTHLVDQDTTQFDNPLHQKNSIKETYMNKGAGTGNIDSAGRLHKKSKHN